VERAEDDLWVLDLAHLPLIGILARVSNLGRWTVHLHEDTIVRSCDAGIGVVSRP
jgi:hypothetical protein